MSFLQIFKKSTPAEKFIRKFRRIQKTANPKVSLFLFDLSSVFIEYRTLLNIPTTNYLTHGPVLRDKIFHLGRFQDQDFSHKKFHFTKEELYAVIDYLMGISRTDQIEFTRKVESAYLGQ